MMESSSQITSSSGQGPEHTQLLPLLHSGCAHTGQTSMFFPSKSMECGPSNCSPLEHLQTHECCRNVESSSQSQEQSSDKSLIDLSVSQPIVHTCSLGFDF